MHSAMIHTEYVEAYIHIYNINDIKAGPPFIEVVIKILSLPSDVSHALLHIFKLMYTKKQTLVNRYGHFQMFVRPLFACESASKNGCVTCETPRDGRECHESNNSNSEEDMPALHPTYLYIYSI